MNISVNGSTVNSKLLTSKNDITFVLGEGISNLNSHPFSSIPRIERGAIVVTTALIESSERSSNPREILVRMLKSFHQEQRMILPLFLVKGFLT